MKECIDFYSRLIIATITFAVPIIIYLLTTFSENLKKKKEELKQKKTMNAAQAAASLETDPTGAPINLTEVIDIAANLNTEVEKSYAEEIEKIKPIKHFWWLFAFLLIAMAFLLMDFFIRDPIRIEFYSHSLSVFYLSLSLFFYSLAIGYIIYTLYLINNIRKALN